MIRNVYFFVNKLFLFKLKLSLKIIIIYLRILCNNYVKIIVICIYIFLHIYSFFFQKLLLRCSTSLRFIYIFSRIKRRVHPTKWSFYIAWITLYTATDHLHTVRYDMWCEYMRWLPLFGAGWAGRSGDELRRIPRELSTREMQGDSPGSSANK